MARSFSNAKLLSAFALDRISISLSRRGYAAASQGVGSGSSKRNAAAMAKKGGDQESTRTSPWVPDPVTGCYRPENHANRIDVAELREALLNNKIRRP